MAYTRVNWVNNVTPLDKAHLDVMDVGIETLDTGKVDKDSVVAAATRIVASKLLAGDAQPAFRVLGDGKMEWGPGGAAAPDSNLYRSASGWLKADGRFEIPYNGGSALQLSGALGGITFGGDVLLARVDSLNLGTTQNFIVGNDLVARSGYGGGPNTAYVALGQRGPASQAGIVFGNLSDTNLYREGADILTTNDSIYMRGGGALAVFAALADANAKFYVAGSNGGLNWGAGGASAVDTNLYRNGAAQLRTDSTLQVPGSAGTAVWGLDATPTASVPVADNAILLPFGNANNFSGLFIVNDVSSGEAAVILAGAGAVVIVGQTRGDFTTTAGTASHVNVFLTGLVVQIENKMGASHNFRVLAFRSRASQ